MVVNIGMNKDNMGILVLGGRRYGNKLSNSILELKCEKEKIDKDNCEWVELEQKLKVPRAWGTTITMP